MTSSWPSESGAIGLRYRHPDNPYGQGSGEFWEEEYRLYGVTREEYHRLWREQAPKCPYCGVPAGCSMGTGDCGCERSE